MTTVVNTIQIMIALAIWSLVALVLVDVLQHPHRQA